MAWTALHMGKLHLYLSTQGSHVAGTGFLSHGHGFSTSLLHSFISPAEHQLSRPPAASLSPASHAVLRLAPMRMQVYNAGNPKFKQHEPTSSLETAAEHLQHQARRCGPCELQGKLCSCCSAAINLHEHLMR